MKKKVHWCISAVSAKDIPSKMASFHSTDTSSKKFICHLVSPQLSHIYHRNINDGSFGKVAASQTNTYDGAFLLKHLAAKHL